VADGTNSRFSPTPPRSTLKRRKTARNDAELAPWFGSGFLRLAFPLGCLGLLQQRVNLATNGLNFLFKPFGVLDAPADLADMFRMFAHAKHKIAWIRPVSVLNKPSRTETVDRKVTAPQTFALDTE
jgi:hypothetical protein